MAFTVWMAVEAIRRGQAGSWLWIILLFGPIGSAVYFFSEYWRGPSIGLRFRFQRAKEAVTTFQDVLAKDRWFDTGDALLALAKAQDAAGDSAAARTTFEELAEKTTRPEVLYHLATLQVAAGEREAATVSLQRIIDEADYVPAYHRRKIRPWVR